MFNFLSGLAIGLQSREHSLIGLRYRRVAHTYEHCLDLVVRSTRAPLDKVYRSILDVPSLPPDRGFLYLLSWLCVTTVYFDSRSKLPCYIVFTVWAACYSALGFVYLYVFSTGKLSRLFHTACDGLTEDLIRQWLAFNPEQG